MPQFFASWRPCDFALKIVTQQLDEEFNAKTQRHKGAKTWRFVLDARAHIRS
jgi:hypothetical protein